MSNIFDDESPNEERRNSDEDYQKLFARLAASGNLRTQHDSDDGDEEGESHEISAAEFFAQISGHSQSDDDDSDDEEEADEDDGNQEFSIGFGLDSDGSVTPLENNGRRSLSFSFTLDEDGNEVPEFRCPSCNTNNNELLDQETDTYKCNACGYEFVPEIYKALSTATAYLDRADQNWQEGRNSRVIKDAIAALKLEPNNGKAYLLRGKAYVEKELFDQAESDFSEAIRISPDYDIAYFERGKTRMYLQKFDDAIADFSKSIGFDPDFAETYRLRAVAYLNQERYEDSIKDYSEALKHNHPDQAQTWFERGYSYSLMGDHQKAVQDYTEAISHDSDHLDSYARRAESYEKLERYQDAIADYKVFLKRIAKGSTADEIAEKIKTLQLKLDPNAEPISFDPDEEVSIWEDVTLTQERKEYRSADRGQELFEKGDLAAAHKEFSEYIKHIPNSVLPYIYRACVNYKAGTLEESLKDLTSATECHLEIIPHETPFTEGTDPRYKNIYLLRAFVYSLLGKKEEVQNDLVGHLRFTLEKSYLEGTWSRILMDLTAVEALSRVFAQVVAAKLGETRTPLQEAILALIMDDRDSALEIVEEAIQADPKNPVNYWARGLSQDESENAIKDFATAAELAGGKAEYFFVQGFKKMLYKRTQEGREDFLKAISLDPNNAEYHEKLGVFLSKANQHDEAIEHLTRAIELNPESKDAYFTRGVSLDWKGETKAALEDLEIAIALEAKPGNVKAKVVQEKIQEIKDSDAKKQTLLSTLEDQAEKLGSASEFIARGEASLKADKWGPAYADFNAALKLEPNNPNAYRFRGATYYKLGDSKSALRDYNQAITLDPKNSELFLNRGILQADSGDSENALADLDEAIRLNPNNAMAFHMRAKVHAENLFIEESMDRATEDFEKAIELNPNDPEVYVSRAEFWGQPCFRGAEKDALADLDQAILLAPDNAAYYLARHKVKLSIKDANGAAEDLTIAYQLDPTNEEVKDLVNNLTAGEDKHSQVVRLMMSAQKKMNANDLAGSIEDLKKASELDPDNESVKSILSQIPPSLLNGTSDLVEDSDISEEDKEKANQYVMSGLKKFEAEDYEGCIIDLSQALGHNPELSVYVLRGMAKFNLGQNEAALLDYSEAIRREPDNYLGYLGRSLIYLKNESYDQAIADYSTVLDRRLELDENNKFDTYIRRGYAYLQTNLFAEAIPDLSEAIMLKPNDPDAYFYRAKAYKELQSYKLAISDFQTCIELTHDEVDKNEALVFIQEMLAALNSEHTPITKTFLKPEPKKAELASAHNLCALELNRTKDFEAALREVQLAKYLTPDDEKPYEVAFAVYNGMQDWTNAISNLQEVIRINPNDSMAHMNLGSLKTKIGDLDGAISSLVKATQLDQNNAEAFLKLGTTYLMKGNHNFALEYLTKSINLNPNIAVAYLHRASTKEKLKDYSASIPDFERYCELGGSPEVPDLTPLQEHIKDLKMEFGVVSKTSSLFEDRKLQLQQEIKNRNFKLEQLKRETSQQVDQLHKEREGLGFLAISKKKEIDQKIISLEKHLFDFAATIEDLNRQLNNLKP